MRLAPGARVGPYEILAPLGVGGMGEVYRARDTRLAREVAIKALPGAFASDPERLRRFEREARAASALNDPNILTVHDVGTHEGSPYLVTELLEGKTLRELVREGALPVARAVDFATQIARGLAAAHERGIVHRDLKPENLFLTRDGRMKILDFGLARLVQPEALGQDSSEASTLTKATEAGAVMGTVGYMSPEQVRGELADARSDIFAFGCVLYEMLTGEGAFARPTAAETMTAVLRDEPRPLAETRPEVPAIVGRLLERCLAKPLDARFRSGRELLLVLEVAGTAPTAPQAAGAIAVGKARAPAARRAALGWLIAGAVGGAALAGAAVLGLFPRGETRARTAPIVASLSLPPGTGSLSSLGGTSDIALSPDGSQLAYVGLGGDGRRALWMRELDSTSPRELPGTADAENPFWSPDGRFVGFFAEGKLKKVGADGGAVQTLCDWSSAFGLGATWNRDGVILFEEGGSILRVSAAGGAPQVVLRRHSVEELALRFPSFLPDGQRFLYFARRLKGPHRLYIGSLSGSEAPRLVHEGHSRAELSATGHLLFVRDGVLVTQPFDEGSLRPWGDPKPIAPRVANHPGNGRASFSVSRHGALAYVEAAGTLTELVWKNRKGRTLERLTEPGRYIGVALSPDGRRVAVEIEDDETNQHVVWVLDPARGVRSRLTKPPHDSHHPVWSPDGRDIAFSSDRAGRWVTYTRRADGLGEDVLLERRPDFAYSYPRQWLREGNTLVVAARKSDAEGQHLWLLPLAEGEPARPLVEGTWGAVSPDGRWLAVAALAAGRSQVYVLPFPALDTRWTLSVDGGNWPQWRADGRELFYVSDTRMLMSVRIREASRFEAAPPESLFPLRAAADTGPGYPGDYAVAADGQRFLICQVPEHAPTRSVTLITDWEGLAARR